MSDPTEISDQRAGQTAAQRYGAARPRRRVVPIVLGTLLVAALTAWAIWAGTATSISADVTSYHVVDSHQVQVKVDVHLPNDQADGTCLVRATAEDHTIVGELNITVEEIQAAEGTWIPIRTERRATTAEVVRCRE